MEDSQDIDIKLETPAADVFIPPSIHHETLLSGASYSHFSPVPPSLLPPTDSTDSDNSATPGLPCALGVDEAGRGPVLGPMVYGAFYLPLTLSKPLLSQTHHFDDSKVLTPAFRSELMERLCTSSPDDTVKPHSVSAPDPASLYANCGWAVEVMSARDISSNMMKPVGMYNLNAQAMDATVSLIQRIYALGVNVKEIYIDTIGQPGPYQKKLERIFPTAKVTVAKKADSLYPCVSAASVCAKVTRDAALEVLYEAYAGEEADKMDVDQPEDTGETVKTVKDAEPDWGSGYPSDARCTGWMKRNMDPVFGWGNECRFSWATTKDMLELKNAAAPVQWPVEEDDETMRLTAFFSAESDGSGEPSDPLAHWFGSSVSAEVF